MFPVYMDDGSQDGMTLAQAVKNFRKAEIPGQLFETSKYNVFKKPAPTMDKRTLKFDCLINMAIFSRLLTAGYLMNTNNFTLTGKFTDEEVANATAKYGAILIRTTDKVFSYENL